MEGSELLAGGGRAPGQSQRRPGFLDPKVMQHLCDFPLWASVSLLCRSSGRLFLFQELVSLAPCCWLGSISKAVCVPLLGRPGFRAPAPLHLWLPLFPRAPLRVLVTGLYLPCEVVPETPFMGRNCSQRSRMQCPPHASGAPPPPFLGQELRRGTSQHQIRWVLPQRAPQASHHP